MMFEMSGTHGSLGFSQVYFITGSVSSTVIGNVRNDG